MTSLFTDIPVVVGSEAPRSSRRTGYGFGSPVAVGRGKPVLAFFVGMRGDREAGEGALGDSEGKLEG